MPRQEVPEASPVVPDPVAPAELAEASVPVEPQASVHRSGPVNEAIVARLQPVAQGIRAWYGFIKGFAVWVQLLAVW